MFSWYQLLSNVYKLIRMEAQIVIDFSTLTCFIDKKMVQQYKLVLVENMH